MIYHPFRHLGLKALSVAIALLAWLSVSGEQTVERSLRVPLELQNIPDQLELVEIPPQGVDVRIRGSSGLLSHLAPGDIVAVIDLSDARPGRRLFALTPDRVHGPSGVQVGQVSPSTITLEFQRTAVRAVKVQPSIEGQPAAGYEVQGFTCQPDAVEVAGPDTLLKQLSRVMTERVSVAGATRDVREVVTLGVASAGLRLKNPGKATVTVHVRPLPLERSFRGVSVILRNVPGGLRGQVSPADVQVDVKGPRENVEFLTSEAFTASLDLAGLRPGRYNLQVHIDAPPRVEVLRVDPASVVVRIR